MDFVVLLLILLETSVYVDFPYNSISLSVVAFLTAKHNLYAVFYAIVIGFIVGLSGSHVERPIIFFMIYVYVLNFIFKHLNYERVNLPLISLVEVILYLTYVYFFEFESFGLLIIIKHYLLVLLMNYILFKTAER